MFWENLLKLCKKNGISPNGMAKQISISSGAVTSWKNGKVPRYATLLKIADYFNVSIDYLLGKEKPAEKINCFPDIFYRFKDLSEDKQKEIIAFMEFKLFQQDNE